MTARESDEPTDQSPWRLTVLLLVLVVLAAAACGWALWHDRQHTPQAHGAISSTGARTGGMVAAARITGTALSYRWSSLDRDTRAAEALMTPAFGQQYARTMARVRSQTLRDRITVRAKVVATSVVRASEQEVQALVFVDQVTTARGSRQPRVDQTRVLVTLTRGAGDWQLSRMRAF